MLIKILEDLNNAYVVSEFEKRQETPWKTCRVTIRFSKTLHDGK